MPRARTTTPTPAPRGRAADSQAAASGLEAENRALRERAERAEREQAELLIENGRLRSTLNEGEARERATADVLRALASSAASATDLRGVLAEIASAAARLGEADHVAIMRVEGDRFWIEVKVPAPDGPPVPAPSTDGARGRPFAEWRGVTARALRERQTIHVPDVLAAEDEYGVDGYRRAGVRAILAIPLLRDGRAIGAISHTRTEARPFTPQQVRLLESFASQATIAIEHARLFAELQASNATLIEKTRQLEEALEEQRATGHVLEVISRSPTDLQTVLDAIVASAVRLCAASDAVIERLEGDRFYNAAHAGSRMRGLVGQPLPLTRCFPGGRAVLDRRPVIIEDLTAVAAHEYPDTLELLKLNTVHSVAEIPLLSNGQPLGSLAVLRAEVRPFSAAEVGLLRTFADQAVIAIENARLFGELEERLEEQTATAEVLRVISESPTDLQPVLHTIAESAARLCSADTAAIQSLEGDQRVSRAVFVPERLRAGRSFPADGAVLGPLHSGHVASEAMRQRRTLHLADVEGPAGEHYPISRRDGRNHGFRALAVTPLLLRGEPYGSLTIARAEPRPFTERQLRLLETFANQAVIAIENARLFQELNDANSTLTEALAQQTATADVLRVIGSAPGDLGAVFRAIVESAARLCSADAIAYVQDERDPGAFVRMGGTGVFSRAATGAGATIPIDPEYVSGAAFLQRRTIVVGDPEGREGDPYPKTRAASRRQGTWTATVYAPLLRKSEPAGVIGLVKATPGSITPQQVTLLETFADQAVVAIENERLFRELRERDDRRAKELERASAIQQRLLPAEVQGWPGVLELAVRFRAAVETSGDFYDVLALAAAKGALEPLQIAVGDVAGKGMSAALVTALARSALRASASVPTGMVTPAGTLRIAGQRLHQDVGGGHFVACALAVVEPPGLLHRGPRLKLSNAAQVPVLFCRDGNATELEAPGDRLPLGVRPDGDYKDVEAELRAGDVVVFASDGLPEAPSNARVQVSAGSTQPQPLKAGELFGFERLAASAAYWSSIGESAEAVAAGIWSDVTAWAGAESHHDDMTLLVLRVPEAQR